jgi:eukaryotic-like serine/threonine-protein kinase
MQPRTLGKYEILDVLGTGGMGTVYRALDPMLQRIVAVKLLRNELRAALGSDDLWSRFRTEARAVARLNHPAIVSVYDFCDTDPAGAFFVMEYVDGCTLDDQMQRAAKLGLAETFDLMDQLLDGLGYAHAQEIVHRDIKPSNLLLTGEGKLKITDFGVAKVGALKQTQIGTAIGTPEYMAPEQYTSSYIDQRCDLYAAGILFFQLLTGRPPFAGTTPQIMYQVCHVMPDPASTIDQAIPTLLDPVLAKALAKDPDDRFQSAWEFSAAITGARKTLGFPVSTGTRRPVVQLAPRARVAASEEFGLSGTLQKVDGTARLDAPTKRASSAPSLAAAPSQAPAKVPAPVRASHPAAPPAGATLPPPGWSVEQLAEIERKLTPIVGPTARILIKRAALLTRDRDQLYRDLAVHLHNEDERKRFLSGIRSDTASPATAAGAPAGTSPPNRVEIAPATLDRTTRILIPLIGPIAAALVKKTAPSACNEVDLYSRLAERITDVKERERFLIEVSRRT